MKHWVDFTPRALVLLLVLPLPGLTSAACDGLFRDGLETPRHPMVEPSGGCGGVGMGTTSQLVYVEGLSLQTYHIHVPPDYDPMASVPWLLVWHGAAGPGTASTQAQATLEAWAPVADAEGFIVIAQEATGSQGGWIPSSAYAIRDAVLNDVATRYNVDWARLFHWGFSAGAHVLHAVALYDSTLYAAYGVNAGSLAGYAGTDAPAGAARRIPVLISIGNRDGLYPYARADRQTFMDAGWTLGSDLYFEEFNGGHTYTEAQLRAFWERLGNFVRP